MSKTRGMLKDGIIALLCAWGPFIPSANAEGLGKFGEWTAPVNLGPTINSAFDDYHPAISNDGLSLYFTSNRPGGFDRGHVDGWDDIWVSRRASLGGPWGPPQHLGANINGEGGTCCPNLSTDEHWLYFAGYRPGGCSSGGPYQLWASYRANTDDDFGWQPAVSLGCRLHASANSAGECAPTYFEDEDTGLTSLYFCREVGGHLDVYDIYVSMLRGDGLFGRPCLVWELTAPTYRNTRTAIRRDGLEMLITSNRPGGKGKNDIWASTRETTLDAWSTPVNLGPTINTAAPEGGPALSADGTTMYFFSDRVGGFGKRDLYVSTRTRLPDPADEERAEK